MSRHTDDAVLVNISDLVKVLSRQHRDKLDPCVYETWLARLYTKAHAIPSISASILGTGLDRPIRNFADQRITLEDNAKRLTFDPLSILPIVPWATGDHATVWFFVKGNFLMMGTGRAIKRGWGNLYHRVS